MSFGSVQYKWRELKWFFMSEKKRQEWFKNWAKRIDLAYDYVHWDYVSMIYEGRFYIVNLKSFYTFGLHTGIAPVFHLDIWSQELRGERR
jgi:hypothetical protein